MCSPSGPPSPGDEVPPGVSQRFEREMGCSEAEWLRWLPGAVGRAVTIAAPSVEVALGEGRLVIAWSALPPRQLGLVCLPRLLVSLRFEHVEPARRETFMRRFDLHTHRGGG